MTITITELLKSRKLSTEEAALLFDQLEPVSLEFMIGKWLGTELFTGSPTDGFLEATGWAGKNFDDVENVFPLVFFTDSARLDTFYVNPLTVSNPEFLSRYKGEHMGELRAEVETHSSTARLRMTEYRGVMSAAMIYDQLPTIDIFKKVNDDCLLGVMDAKGALIPYYFLLHRV
jgi:hypothetical protein